MKAERYQRHSLIDWFPQEKIKAAKIGIVGCGEAVSNDHVTDTIPVTKSASVKRGVSVEKQAQALAALSVISERGGDLVSRYKECRLDSAPSDFNCVDFLYAIRIATTKFKRDNIICNLSRKKKINFLSK